MRRLVAILVFLSLAVSAQAQMTGTFRGRLYGPGYMSFLTNPVYPQFTGYLGGVEQIRIGSDGLLTWATDTTLYRLGAGALKTDGGLTLGGNLEVPALATVDGVDVSVHAANADAHHAQLHAASHAAAQPDALTLAESQITNLVTDLAGKLANPANIVTVGSTKCHFTTIQAAVDSITDAGPDKRYTVLIYPGEYAERVNGKQYVSLIGLNRQTCVINAPADQTKGIYTAADETIANLTVNCVNTPATSSGIGGSTTADNVLIYNCTINSVDFGVYLRADDVSVINCTINAVEAAYFLNCQRPRLVYCSGYWSGSTANTNCTAPVDLSTSTDAYVAFNRFETILTGGGPADSAYLIGMNQQGNHRIEHNFFHLTCWQPELYGIYVLNYGAEGSGTHRIIGNTFLMHTTHANPTNYFNFTYQRAQGFKTSDMLLLDNTIRCTGDNPISGTYYSLYATSGTAGNPDTIFIDDASLGRHDTALTMSAIPAGLTITYLGLDRLHVNGDLTISGTVDGVDVSTIPATYAPKANPTLTGTVKLADDATANCDMFGTGVIGDDANGKCFAIWRKAAEGNSYLEFYINNVGGGVINGSVGLEFHSPGNSFWGATGFYGGNYTFGESWKSGAGTNRTVDLYGYITDPDAPRYARFKVVNDGAGSKGRFVLSRQDVNVKSFEIQMPVKVTNQLEVETTTGAFIVPRMTTEQRDALAAINGMIVYNTTTTAFNFYEAGAWVTK